MAALIWIALAAPLLLAAVSFVLRRHGRTLWLPVLAAGILLAVGAALVVAVRSGGPVSAAGGLLRADALSAWMLTLVGGVAVIALWAGVPHRADRRGSFGVFATLLSLFLTAMTLAVLADNLGLLWVAIELTTITTAFLVGYRGGRGALEAAWKYVVLGSVGIAIAFLGIVLLYAASRATGEPSLSWLGLLQNADGLDPDLARAAGALTVLGFATKVGLAPMHSWLPDAQSQAPAPVSGLMSGVLLNCAMYGIMRFYIISEVVNPGFAKTLLLVFGLLSILVATAFILVSKDIKRMLAYSSVENMGLISIALGIGTPLALFGALFLVLAHSISKPLMFFCSGNMTQAYGTRAMSEIRGVTGKMRFTGLSTTAGALAVAGAPPFPLFTGELILLFAAINSGMYVLAGVLIILLAIIFAGLTRSIFPMLSGNTNKKVSERRSVTRKISILALVIGALFVGLFMPASVENVLLDMVTILSGGLP